MLYLITPNVQLELPNSPIEILTFITKKRMMKCLLLLLALPSYSFSQNTLPFTVEIEAISIENAPSIHSYSFGVTDDQKWLIIGGRVDGLHQRQPFASFRKKDNNEMVFVIDPIENKVWSSNLNVLPTSLFDQLASTNQEFQQRDSMLYVIGGYGKNENGHLTFPNLTAISINELADAIINNLNIRPFFRQIKDDRMKVTGGEVGLLNGRFYLVGGQLFDGSYNPMGSEFGPGFIQKYTNEIRSFELIDDGSALSIENYSVINDPKNLHRRDYNMASQQFPSGEKGFTVFSGVFNSEDMPFLTTVDISTEGYKHNANIQQLLSQYHCPKIPIFDESNNTMHTLFFGGISEFQLDESGNLVGDIDVPFVKTISRMTRFSDGSMQESDLVYVKMPALLGSGSEFISVDKFYDEMEILQLEVIPSGRVLVGYIYGGIESSEENIFFVNDGSQSNATSTVFKVYLNKGVKNDQEKILVGSNIIDISIYPKSPRKKLEIIYFAVEKMDVELTITDVLGNIVHNETITAEEIGLNDYKFDISNLRSGTYTLFIADGIRIDERQFTKK